MRDWKKTGLSLILALREGEMNGMAAETALAAEHPNYAYIDALRGWAILLVITCHATFSYPELPYPVHRLTELGWHGVQLFFLASCVTLLMSWHGEMARRGRADTGAFFIRRVFRMTACPCR